MKPKQPLTRLSVWTMIAFFVFSGAPATAKAAKGSLEMADQRILPFSMTGKRHALLIGVDRFENPAGHRRLDRLPEVKNDLEDLSNALKRSGFVVETLHSGTTPKPTRGQILLKVEQMNARTHDDDTVLVYFSGHGEGEYLYTYNYDPGGSPSATCLKVEELSRKIKANKLAARKILVVDACHSGVAVDGTTKAKGGQKAALDFQALDRISDKGFFVLASCQAGERSWIDKKAKRSYFTKHLVKGLLGAADGRAGGLKDCRIDLLDLYKYIHEEADAEVHKEVRDENNKAPTQRARLKIDGAPMVYLASVPGCQAQQPLTAEELEDMRRLQKELKDGLDEVRKENEAIRKERESNRKEREANARERLQLKEMLRLLRDQQQTLKESMASFRYRNRELDQREKAMLEKMKKQSEELSAKARNLARQQEVLNDQSRQIDEREKRIVEREAGVQQALRGIGEGKSGSYEVESIGYKMVFIPPGTFTMGSPEGDGESDEHPQRQVTLTKGFYMGVTEVTQGQWKAVMGSNPSYFKNCGDDCPVENVSWDDVQRFIKKLNQKTGQRFALPTEAQWEYAATGGGKDIKYPWGNDAIDGTRANYCDKNCIFNWADRAHDDGYKETAPVASYPKGANALGLHDMAGNVWEWCQDWYGAYKPESVTDPKGAEEGVGRVIRGGGWYNRAGYCRSADRLRGRPGGRSNFLGFRLVLLPGQ